MTVSKSWAKLTMYDRLLHDPRRSPRAANSLRQTRPFVISNRAADRLGEAMALYPELIAENAEFAIPPFPLMWIEFDSRVMLDRDRVSGANRNFAMTDADVRVGYFIDGDRVGVFAEGEDLVPTSMPISYRLNSPMSHNQEMAMAEWLGTTRMGLDPFLWGHTMHQTLDSEHQRMLRARHSFYVGSEKFEALGGIDREALYIGSAGELRNIIAVLLLINQPTKIIQTREVARQRGLVKGKPMSYWGHSLIDLDIDRSRRVNLLAKPKRGQGHFPLRWHEVRGHFFHRNARGADHSHVWLPDADRDQHWFCSHPGCRATRTWRTYPNGRGSAETGYIDQTRRIKTKED